MRGANFFQKPEAALQRAQEFISVGKEQDALEALHDVIKDRRHKQWSQTHELILMKHLELCVNLRNSSLAKDALYQYKALTQNVAVKSLEDVMVHFLDLAERKTEDAQKASIEKIEEIDDLDIGDAPENILLSVVSGAVAQDRMDRTVLSPWLRFLWDSFRNCLDLLRNNALVEQLYHKIARQSFDFCAKYQRRNEFRKLCELLRMHLSQIQKNQGISHAVKLTQAESLATMQDTRLVQLDTAIKMELWQEAYKSAEDLQFMMQLSKEKDKRMVKPTSYANYYDKLALVFWKGGNPLFHAAALLQKFTIYKDMKKSFNEDEATEQATRVLLATLSIPDGADSPSILTKHLDIEDLHLQNIRVLSTLLRLPIAPTRAGIMKEIIRLNIPELAINTARKLYTLMELDFSPLKIATNVQIELDEIKNLSRIDYAQYIDRIKSVVAAKVIKQVTLIYDSLSLSRLRRIIPESFYNRIELEKTLVEISKYGFVKAQIDHRNRSVCFGPQDATLAGDAEADFESDEPQNGLEMVRTHLETLYTRLVEAVYVLDGANYQNEALNKLSSHIDIWQKTKDKDYENILNRRKKIEHYKEQSESLRQELTRQNQLEAYKKEELRRAEEMRRLELEGKEAEKKRRFAEQEEIKKKIKMEQIKRFQQNPLYQAIIKEKGEELVESMDPEAVIREQRQRLDKERRDQLAKQMQQEKKIDHWIRAVYLEEIKEYKKISEERRANAPSIHQEYEARRVDKANQEHQKSILKFQRITKANEDATEFLKNIVASHREEFAQAMIEWKARLDTTRADRLYEQRLHRAKERKKIYEQQKMMEEREKEMEQRAMQQRQQQATQQERQPNREERRGDRPPQPIPESKADDDRNWRGGAKPVQQPPPPQLVQPPQRVIERPVVPVREDVRRTGPPPPQIPVENKADEDFNWRKGAGSTQQAQHPSRQAPQLQATQPQPASQPWRPRIRTQEQQQPITPTQPTDIGRMINKPVHPQPMDGRQAAINKPPPTMQRQPLNTNKPQPPKSRADTADSWRK